MKWTRETPGTYIAGPYRIERRDSWWYATGPGIESGAARKDILQRYVASMAEARLSGEGKNTATPVVGDTVVYAGRRGFVNTIQNYFPLPPLYCIHFSRGRKLCLNRHEFTVVIP